ncbi:hypothetical protein EJ07DRAFT_154090 [Lizonia empirigonia]|nr:hypothetical protein EJ07DRAFT_154090 [Lizonia empirigonia]
MGDPYGSGHDQGYVYAAGHGSLSDMMDSNYYDTSRQQAFVSSSATTRRHDSVNSQLSPHVSGYLAGQQQAECQPCAMPSTPHNNSTYPYQSELMSRGASHASHLSSNSSGQRYSGSPHFVPHNSFPSTWPPNAIDMQRSRSVFSNTSTLHSQQISPHLQTPQIYQDHTIPCHQELIEVLSTCFSNTTQHLPPSTHMNESAIDCFSNGTTDINLLELGIGHFDHNTG